MNEMVISEVKSTGLRCWSLEATLNRDNATWCMWCSTGALIKRAFVRALEHGEWQKRVWTVERMGLVLGWGVGGQTTGRNSDERVEWLARGDIIFNLINPPDREAIGCSQRKKGFFFFYSVPFQFCHGALSAKCCVQGLVENSRFWGRGEKEPAGNAFVSLPGCT